MTAIVRRTLALLPLVALTGCQQWMAKQPSYRPLVPTPFYADGRSNRPLEPGVVSRDQALDDDPLVTGLTDQGRKPAPTGRADEQTPQPGAPSNLANFSTTFPFKLNEDDLRRGQQRYTIYCTPCHGALGNGSGKIVERGFLRPPSYHTTALEPNEPGESGDLQRGYSRGFHRFGIKVPLRDVPVGYIFEVISKGYGGMPEHAAQIPPADRWRIAAYVRALQLSQHAEVDKLPGDVKAVVNQALTEGGKK